MVAAVGGLFGPFERGFDGRDEDGVTFDAVLLAVPDAAIAEAAALIVDGPMVGHCAGALGLAVLGERERFSVHPLTSVPVGGGSFTGCGAAVDGSSERALGLATQLATSMGMLPVHIADEDRPAYHAAASIASNFLTTLEDAAEALLATTGAPRQLLVPLVRGSVEHWAALGGEAALSGPIARGDATTVARQRHAVGERTPHLLEMFDVMAALTEQLAERQRRVLHSE